MIQTIEALNRMRDSLLAFADANHENPSLAEAVDRMGIPSYTASICCKLKLLDHHARFLTSMRWDRLSSVGSPGVSSVDILCGNQDDVVIQIRSVDAARQMVFVAFDGLVAASVNAADTLGRLVNLIFALRVDHNRANLPEINKKVPAGSPLGSVLRSRPGIEWMKPLRDLRGECQHWDIASVIEIPGSSLGVAPEELNVRERYLLPGSPDRKVSSYAATVRDRTVGLLRNAAEAIASDPKDACLDSQTTDAAD